MRILAKDLVAGEVAAGRRSLFEAAALFGALNRLPPEAMPLSLTDSKAGGPRLPARTDEARLCRQVIVWVPAVLKGWPADEAKSVTARLEREFWEELRERGVIRLPDPHSLEPVEVLLARARGAWELRRGRGILGPPEGP